MIKNLGQTTIFLVLLLLTGCTEAPRATAPVPLPGSTQVDQPRLPNERSQTGSTRLKIQPRHQLLEEDWNPRGWEFPETAKPEQFKYSPGYSPAYSPLPTPREAELEFDWSEFETVTGERQLDFEPILLHPTEYPSEFEPELATPNLSFPELRESLRLSPSEIALRPRSPYCMPGHVSQNFVVYSAHDGLPLHPGVW